MFGVVPKVLWERQRPADERNRIAMTANCPLVESGDDLLLIGYDHYPLDTIANKKRWLPRAAEEGWLCLFDHDPEVPMARLREDRPGRFTAEPLVETPVLAS